MANCGINGIIWNTCDTRPIVKLSDAKSCQNLGLTTQSSNINTFYIDDALGLSGSQAGTVIKNGVLLDKNCLPKLNTTTTNFFSFGITATTAGTAGILSSPSGPFSTNAPDNFWLKLMYNSGGTLGWADANTAAVQVSGGAVTLAPSLTIPAAGTYTVMFFGSADAATYYPLYNADIYQYDSDGALWSNGGVGSLNSVTNDGTKWVLGKISSDSCTC